MTGIGRGGPIPETGSLIQPAATHRDFTVDKVRREAGRIDAEAKPRPVRQAHFALGIDVEMIRGDVQGERLGRHRIFADAVVREARVGLEGGDEGQMRGEGVIDVGHALPHRIVRDLLGRADAADTPAIDLNEADLAVVDQMARHMHVVRRLRRGRAYLRSPPRAP